MLDAGLIAKAKMGRPLRQAQQRFLYWLRDSPDLHTPIALGNSLDQDTQYALGDNSVQDTQSALLDNLDPDTQIASDVGRSLTLDKHLPACCSR